MTHDWSEKDFDWKGLNDCLTILYRIARRYGRLGGDIKEKWGQARFYARFGHLSLHTLVYPGYVYNQFPDWLWRLDCAIIGPSLRFLFERLFARWQMKAYNTAYQRCLKKYPHLRAELLCGADWPELIRGATRKEGNITYILGWDGDEIGRRERLL